MHFKTGRFSRSLPTRLAADFAVAMADPELLSLRASAAVLESRVTELLTRLDAGDSIAWRKSLTKSWSAVRGAADPAALKDALAAHGEVVVQGGKADRTWADLTEAIKDFSAIASKEHSRLVDLHQVMTIEQAMTFVGAVSAAVMKHVADKDVQAVIGLELGQLLNRRPQLTAPQRLIDVE